MKKKLKIRTLKGRIITLTVSKQTDTQIYGTDKFGEFVIVAIEDIHSMFPIEKVVL